MCSLSRPNFGDFSYWLCRWGILLTSAHPQHCQHAWTDLKRKKTQINEVDKIYISSVDQSIISKTKDLCKVWHLVPYSSPFIFIIMHEEGKNLNFPLKPLCVVLENLRWSPQWLYQTRHCGAADRTSFQWECLFFPQTKTCVIQKKKSTHSSFNLYHSASKVDKWMV